MLLYTSRLTEVEHYDPGDLTIGIGAGWTIAQLSSKVGAGRIAVCRRCATSRASHSWRIAGHRNDGPLRHGYGGLRDYCIGIKFVTGDGRKGKGGGRVVKNVAGFDMMKLLIGSQGTLAVITGAELQTVSRAAPDKDLRRRICRRAAEAIEFRNPVLRSPLSPICLELVSPRRSRMAGQGTSGKAGRSTCARREVTQCWLAIAANLELQISREIDGRRRETKCGGRLRTFRTLCPSAIRRRSVLISLSFRWLMCCRVLNELEESPTSNGLTYAVVGAWELAIYWLACGRRRGAKFRAHVSAFRDRLPRDRQHVSILHARRHCAAIVSLGENADPQRQHAGGEARARSERHSESREVSLLSFATPVVENPSSNFSPGEKPTWDLYSKCVHCGLCLDQCPTYRVLGTEMDSPRGRIYQMLQVDEGRLALGDSFVTHIDRCLGCLNCQTACPSGVQYGHLLENTRAQIEQNYQRPWLQRKLREHFYAACCRRSASCRARPSLLRFYQRSGLQSLARATGLLKLMGVDELDALSPRIESDFSFRDLGKVFPAEGVHRGRVAMLIGCISSVAFAELNRATIRVLTKNGIEVCIPEAQSCCGALHAHAGLLDLARAQARKNIDAMLSPEFDAIVSNAAGCGATMKEYAVLLEHDPEYAERAREFVAKVRDITEYLAEVGLREPKRKLNDARDLLRSLPPGACAGHSQTAARVAESDRRRSWSRCRAPIPAAAAPASTTWCRTKSR